MPLLTADRVRAPHLVQYRRTAHGAPDGRRAKVRMTERLVASLLLVIAAPLLGAIWIAVRGTSAGPGLYRQRRAGLRGREFSIYKFRTMRHDCEAKTGAVWATPGDSRVTPLGKFLRATHLDELPQLVNVIRGEMSFVGPRPERPEIIARLVRDIPDYETRLQVLPGVTGLAQIHAAPDLTLDDVRRKLRYDLRYIAEASLWLDVRIVACTVLKMVGLNTRSLRGLLFPRTNRQESRLRIDSPKPAPQLSARS